MHRHPLAFLFAATIATLAGPVYAADPPDATARRVMVEFDHAVGCSSAQDLFPKLKAAYYSNLDDVGKHAGAIVNGCAPSIPDGEPVVLMFFIKTTDAADKPLLAHILLEKNPENFLPLHDLLGRKTVHWVYVTDDDCDEKPIVELSETKVVNPAIANLGALAKTVLPVVPGTVHAMAAKTKSGATVPKVPAVAPVPPCSQQKPAGPRVHLSIGKAVVPYARGTVNESAYLRRILRDTDGTWFKEDGKTKTTDMKDAGWVQLEGSTAFGNTPMSFVTFHAGAAVLSNLSGARQMKIDSDKFISDPLNRVATLTGVSWHLPYDGTEATPSKKERIGIFTGAVLTPAPGIAIGGVYAWRGFGLFAGWGQMWVKTAPNDLSEGAAVPAGTTLVYKTSRGFLIGATYAFGS